MPSRPTLGGIALLLTACGGRTALHDDRPPALGSGGAPSVPSPTGGGGSKAAGSGGVTNEPPTPCRSRDIGKALGFPVAEGVLAGPSANMTPCGGKGPEAWFRWTAPFAGTFGFAATGDGTLLVAIYDESSGCQRLNPSACQVGDPAFITLLENQGILVSVDTNDTGGGFVLDAWGAAGHAGTDCADVDVGAIAPGPVRVGLLTDAIETARFSCTGDVLPAVVTSWTAPRAGTYTFDTTGSNVDTLLEVRRACSGDTLGCSDDYVGRAARLQLFFEAGGTASIFVGYRGGKPDVDHYVLAITASN